MTDQSEAELKNVSFPAPDSEGIRTIDEILRSNELFLDFFTKSREQSIGLIESLAGELALPSAADNLTWDSIQQLYKRYFGECPYLSNFDPLNEQTRLEDLDRELDEEEELSWDRQRKVSFRIEGKNVRRANLTLSLSLEEYNLWLNKIKSEIPSLELDLDKKGSIARKFVRVKNVSFCLAVFLRDDDRVMVVAEEIPDITLDSFSSLVASLLFSESDIDPHAITANIKRGMIEQLSKKLGNLYDQSKKYRDSGFLPLTLSRLRESLEQCFRLLTDKEKKDLLDDQERSLLNLLDRCSFVDSDDVKQRVSAIKISRAGDQLELGQLFELTKIMEGTPYPIYACLTDGQTEKRPPTRIFYHFGQRMECLVRCYDQDRDNPDGDYASMDREQRENQRMLFFDAMWLEAIYNHTAIRRYAYIEARTQYPVLVTKEDVVLVVIPNTPQASAILERVEAAGLQAEIRDLRLFPRELIL